MAVFTTIGAAIFGAGTFLAGVTAAGLQIVAGLAVSLIAKGLQGEPQAAKFGVQGRLQAGEDVPRSINFGWNCTAGSLVWHGTFGDGGTMSARVIALGDLPIRELLYPIVDGADCTLLKDEGHPDFGWPVSEYRKDGQDHLWLKFYDGSQLLPDPHLVGTFGADPNRPYGSDRVGRGVPYVVVYARAPERNDEGDKPLFQGIPSFKFVTIGTRLYNPAEDSSVGGVGPHRWDDPSTWGGNGDYSPVVFLYNLLRGLRDGVSGQWLYGMQNITAARLPVANWIAGINAAQTFIPGISGPEPTYRAGGEIQVGAQVATAVEALLTAANARLVENGGVYTIFVGPPGEPVMSFSDDDILSTEEQSFTPFLSLADTINGLDATYPNPGEGWNAKKAPPILRPDLEAKDGNRRLMASVSLDLVPYPGQVQRLMHWAFAEAMRARRHTVVMGPEFRRIEPGDVLAWTSARNGYIAKLFRVDGVVYKANLDVILDLTEVDPADYDWNEEDYRPVIDGPMVVVGPTPMPMTGWQVFPAVLYDDQGRPRRPSIEVRYAPNRPDVRAVRVQVRIAGNELPIFDGEAPYGVPYSTILSGQFSPNTAYEVRGIFIRMGEGSGEWSEWLPVTTPDVRLGAFDLYEGVIGFEHLQQDLAEYQSWIGDGVRDLVDEAKRIARLTVAQDLSNYQQIRTTRHEIKVSEGRITAAYQNAITVAVGPDSALVQRIEELEVSVGEDVALAIASLTAMIEATENGLDALSMDLVSLELEINGDIATATSILQSQINSTNGRVTSEASRIDSLNTTVNGVSANANFRMSVEAGPAGYSSRLGMEARVGSAGTYRSASLFIDVPASAVSPTRVAVAADQFVVAPSGASSSAFRPFIVQGGVVYIDNARIRDLTGDQIRVNSIDAANYLLNGSVVTDKLRGNAVTDAITFTGNGQQGTLTDGNFNVTNGRVLMIAAGFLDRPSDNSANFGQISFKLKYNGLTIKTFVASYDDQSGYGVPLVHELMLPSGVYHFSFHADNLSGVGLWRMLPGSTLTLINLKR